MLQGAVLKEMSYCTSFIKSFYRKQAFIKVVSYIKSSFLITKFITCTPKKACEVSLVRMYNTKKPNLAYLTYVKQTYKWLEKDPRMYLFQLSYYVFNGPKKYGLKLLLASFFFYFYFGLKTLFQKCTYLV